MPEMSTLSSKSKTPMLPSQGVSYARWGRWMDAFSSCLTLVNASVPISAASATARALPTVPEHDDMVSGSAACGEWRTAL